MKERNGVVDNSHLSARASGVSLTGDPIDQPRGHNPAFQAVDDSAFAIPGLDPDAVAPEGVDAGADDEGCEGGACKI